MLKGLELPQIDTGGFNFGGKLSAGSRWDKPTEWRPWLTKHFPDAVHAGFAKHHEEFWEWLWAIEPDSDPAPFVGIWPRGGGKSTGAELGASALGLRGKRKYVLYIRDTQERADDSVANIGALLEHAGAERRVNKYGHSRGWRRNRLRTAGGFTVDALGLDAAGRGVKLENQRPDVIIFDDIDGRHDTPSTTEKKIATITDSLLPAGTDNVAVLVIQNLIIPDGVVSQLSDGRADFLSGRIVSGPHPAVRHLETEKREQQDGTLRDVIVDGVASWAGQSVAACQRLIDRLGLSAFLRECQHEVEAPAGGMFNHLTYRRCNWDEVPWTALVRAVVWVDPAVTNHDGSDSHGIQADALHANGTIYRLFSWENRTTPEDSLRRAILKAVEIGAHEVGVETDQGGDTWISVFNEAARKLVGEGEISAREVPSFKAAKAGAGHGPKAHRGSQMLPDYERGRVIHVRGTHITLERALDRFPKTKPFDLVDCAYWSWQDLREGGGGPATSHREMDDDYSMSFGEF